MNFTFTPAQETFRREIRDFLRTEMPPDDGAEESGAAEEGRVSQPFSRKLGAKGWIGLAYPKEFGGQGLGYIERFVYNEEMVFHRAPLAYHQTAERQMGPSIIQDGNAFQKASILPRITKGELSICIGYSEPNSGSDLAAVETSAVQDGDDYVINGQKIWTTNAQLSQFIWLAARTDPKAAKHKGISVFLVPMDAKGVRLVGIPTMAGTRLNQVFFDNVRVHSRYMVGQKNQGWYVVAANLDFERSGIERVTANLLTFEELTAYARTATRQGVPIIKDDVLRHRLAELKIGFTLGRMLAFRVSWLQSQGQTPNYEASVSKLFGSELSQRTAQVGMQVLGLHAQVSASPKWARLKGRLAASYLVTIADTIRAGTSEVQRNIISQRGLGLPR
jgi:alkylation response protein AidB-like acyl-CoA dehydrogenase